MFVFEWIRIGDGQFRDHVQVEVADPLTQQRLFGLHGFHRRWPHAKPGQANAADPALFHRQGAHQSHQGKVAGTTGDLLAVSPYTGEILGKIDVRDPVRLAPIVANRTIYVLTDSGRLIALR